MCIRDSEKLVPIYRLTVFDDEPLSPTTIGVAGHLAGRWESVQLPPNRALPSFRCWGPPPEHRSPDREWFLTIFPPSVEDGRVPGTAHSAPKSRPFVEFIKKAVGLPVCAQGARGCRLKETKTEVWDAFERFRAAHKESPLTR